MQRLAQGVGSWPVTPDHVRTRCSMFLGFFGRGERIRTSDPSVPNRCRASSRRVLLMPLAISCFGRTRQMTYFVGNRNAKETQTLLAGRRPQPDADEIRETTLVCVLDTRSDVASRGELQRLERGDWMHAAGSARRQQSGEQPDGAEKSSPRCK